MSWLGERFAHPRRYDNLRRIQALDPEVDYNEILNITSRHEFPWDYLQGTGIAFMRDYGVPSISRLLHQTGEFEKSGMKRYDDTLLIGEESTIDGIDSERGHAAVRRLNRIHGHYDIPNHEFAYVLATTIVGPVRWIETYGWRGLDENELIAITRVTTRFGELMGIKGLPNTYDGYLNLLVDYEREHFAPDPANTALAEASIDIARATMPAPARPLVRPMVLALMDQPLLDALGLDRPRAWFASAVKTGLRLRALALRFSPPRTEPALHEALTYPTGHSLSQLGPTKMIDALNAQPTRSAAHA